MLNQEILQLAGVLAGQLDQYRQPRTSWCSSYFQNAERLPRHAFTAQQNAGFGLSDRKIPRPRQDVAQPTSRRDTLALDKAVGGGRGRVAAPAYRRDLFESQ